MQITKKGFLFKPEGDISWWQSHCMAPAAIKINETTLRVYMGCWDSQGISRIGFIDVDINNPQIIKAISQKPVLDIGDDGCFDENGVFPAHVIKEKDRIILFYTGFQLGHKIRHYNFGGAAVSTDGGNTFSRISNAPVLDRSDEGLFVRAGQSTIFHNQNYHSVYSAGSSWREVKEVKRPEYDIFYQQTFDPFNLSKSGKKILTISEQEHGLGRPQIISLGEKFYIFYTRRIIKDMNYHMGMAVSDDLINWTRSDDLLFKNIPHGEKNQFDSEMVYFPCVVKTDENQAVLFYSGNGFGKDGLGYSLIENFK